MGLAHLEGKYQWLRAEITIKDKTFSFDSRKKEDLERAKRNPGLGSLASSLYITFSIDLWPSGKITRTLAQLKLPGQRPLKAAVEDNQGLQKLFTLFPEEGIKIGGKWRGVVLLDVGGLSISKAAQYTLDRKDVRRNEDCVVFKASPQFLLKNYKKEDSEDPDEEKEKTEGQEEAVFSLERGKLFQQEYSADLLFFRDSKYGKLKWKISLKEKYTLRD